MKVISSYQEADIIKIREKETIYLIKICQFMYLF